MDGEHSFVFGLYAINLRDRDIMRAARREGGVSAASGGRAIREHSRCRARLGSAIRLHCSTLFRNGLRRPYYPSR